MKKLFYFFIFVFSPFIFAQSDCVTAIPVCGDTPISYTPSGHGNVTEDLGGCLVGDEHYSVWYTFTVGTSGTLTFLITPNSQADYDWAVYGPNVGCNALGGPIRCSYAGTGSGILTGLNMTATDLSEGAGGDGFVQFMNVVAGQTYYLVVDNFSASSVGFTLTWGGTATLNSPFNDPAIQPNPFIAPGPNHDGNVIICSNPTVFDFHSLDAGIINGNPNFFVTYYYTPNDALTGNNPITAPITVNTTNVYQYTIGYNDPTNPTNPINKCKSYGTIKFVQGTISGNNDTVLACHNNFTGVGSFNLTSANVFTGNASITYYPTLANLNAGTNQITNPTNYQSAQGNIFALITTPQNCTAIATISLQFHPVVDVVERSLSSCFIEGNPTTAMFDLTSAAVTTSTPVVKTYHVSLADAQNGTNAIANPSAYISPDAIVYVRITNSKQCWNVAKINLQVRPPFYSDVLKDQIICVEDVTTLNAGPGFTSYLWSNGDTTSSISNVHVGNYWVELTTNGCVTRQNVKVMASPSPVISNVNIENNTITVSAVGGTLPYEYSLDGINWQNSNVFTNVPRGINNLQVKDSYDCEPVTMKLTVPNLVNAITPNGDGINDALDYSALSYKKDVVFTVYDRYGNKIHVADKNNRFRWDGTATSSVKNKKVTTGTYWYTITWKEDNGTETKYSNWVLVKNIY